MRTLVLLLSAGLVAAALALLGARAPSREKTVPPKPSAAGPAESRPDPLAPYFEEASACVPVDNPPVPVGACPVAKPQSRALPIADVPMCVLLSGIKGAA